jgi:rhamnose transport system ATP-binding protein
VLAVAGYSHPTEFEAISFALRRGEILGFYDLVGAGRSELMQALFGTTRPSRGVLQIDGQTAVIRSPAEAIARGIVYVPEHRGQQGAIRGLPIFQNVTLPSLARAYTSRLDLGAAALDQDVGQLSGGNEQKVVIAKWLATPRVIVLDEPTRGIDIGSKAAVHEFMAELAGQGLATSWSPPRSPRSSACPIA